MTEDADLSGVDVVIEAPAWAMVDLAHVAVTGVGATLTHLDLGSGWEVAVLGCDDARIATLNGEFRDRPGATNVLSWPTAERGAATDGATPAPPDPGMAELGDIAIAYGVCAAEAEAAGKPLADHALHLIVHATLHLLGYDHVRDADAVLMEATEARILARLGRPDPYAA